MYWSLCCRCSVIEVASPELARKTIDVMHRLDIRGRQIIVREASSQFQLSFAVALWHVTPYCSPVWQRRVLCLSVSRSRNNRPVFANFFYACTFLRLYLWMGWLVSRVVSMLDSAAEGPGFKSQWQKVMAACHWVYDSHHLQADCQELESAPEPYT